MDGTVDLGRVLDAFWLLGCVCVRREKAQREREWGTQREEEREEREEEGRESEGPEGCV